MHLIPSEFTIGGVYMPPLLIASLIGIVAATITAILLNRIRLSRYMASPPLVFIAIAVIYTCVIGTFLIPI